MKRLLSIPLACAVNLGLFALIQGLVQQEPSLVSVNSEPLTLSMVRAELTPPPPDEPEPAPEPQVTANDHRPAAPAPPLVLAAVAPPAQLSSPTAPALGLPFQMKGQFRLGKLAVGVQQGTGRGVVATADIAPSLRVPPSYPAQAERDRIEGFVVVEFDILGDGSVDDVAIVFAEPPRIFNRAVARAVRQWKFPLSAAGSHRTERIEFKPQGML